MNPALGMPAALTLALASFTFAAQDAQNAKITHSPETCPMHAEHMSADHHHKLVEKNGDHAMGFPHDKTTHHFRILPNGGAIEVTTNDPADKTSAVAIRDHLAQITELFSNGDFSQPMFIHDGIPPGVTTMKLLKAKIRYRYEEVAAGGRVSIQSEDPFALAGIHDFLRFQISEHETGDPLIPMSAQ